MNTKTFLGNTVLPNFTFASFRMEWRGAGQRPTSSEVPSPFSDKTLAIMGEVQKDARVAALYKDIAESEKLILDHALEREIVGRWSTDPAIKNEVIARFVEKAGMIKKDLEVLKGATNQQTISLSKEIKIPIRISKASLKALKKGDLSVLEPKSAQAIEQILGTTKEGSKTGGSKTVFQLADFLDDTFGNNLTSDEAARLLFDNKWEHLSGSERSEAMVLLAAVANLKEKGADVRTTASTQEALVGLGQSVETSRDSQDTGRVNASITSYQLTTGVAYQTYTTAITEHANKKYAEYARGYLDGEGGADAMLDKRQLVLRGWTIQLTEDNGTERPGALVGGRRVLNFKNGDLAQQYWEETRDKNNPNTKKKVLRVKKSDLVLSASERVLSDGTFETIDSSYPDMGPVRQALERYAQVLQRNSATAKEKLDAFNHIAQWADRKPYALYFGENVEPIQQQASQFQRDVAWMQSLVRDARLVHQNNDTEAKDRLVSALLGEWRNLAEKNEVKKNDKQESTAISTNARFARVRITGPETLAAAEAYSKLYPQSVLSKILKDDQGNYYRLVDAEYHSKEVTTYPPQESTQELTPDKLPQGLKNGLNFDPIDTLKTDEVVPVSLLSKTAIEIQNTVSVVKTNIHARRLFSANVEALLRNEAKIDVSLLKSLWTSPLLKILVGSNKNLVLGDLQGKKFDEAFRAIRQSIIDKYKVATDATEKTNLEKVYIQLEVANGLFNVLDQRTRTDNMGETVINDKDGSLYRKAQEKFRTDGFNVLDDRKNIFNAGYEKIVEELCKQKSTNQSVQLEMLLGQNPDATVYTFRSDVKGGGKDPLYIAQVSAPTYLAGLKDRMKTADNGKKLGNVLVMQNIGTDNAAIGTDNAAANAVRERIFKESGFDAQAIIDASVKKTQEQVDAKVAAVKQHLQDDASNEQNTPYYTDKKVKIVVEPVSVTIGNNPPIEIIGQHEFIVTKAESTQKVKPIANASVSVNDAYKKSTAVHAFAVPGGIDLSFEGVPPKVNVAGKIRGEGSAIERKKERKVKTENFDDRQEFKTPDNNIFVLDVTNVKPGVWDPLRKGNVAGFFGNLLTWNIGTGFQKTPQDESGAMEAGSQKPFQEERVKEKSLRFASAMHDRYNDAVKEFAKEKCLRNVSVESMKKALSQRDKDPAKTLLRGEPDPNAAVKDWQQILDQASDKNQLFTEYILHRIRSVRDQPVDASAMVYDEETGRIIVNANKLKERHPFLQITVQNKQGPITWLVDRRSFAKVSDFSPEQLNFAGLPAELQNNSRAIDELMTGNIQADNPLIKYLEQHPDTDIGKGVITRRKGREFWGYLALGMIGMGIGATCKGTAYTWARAVIGKPIIFP